MLHTDLWEVTAAYAFHLIRNHTFVDGEKRIAAVAMGTCLELNGAPMRVEAVELYQGRARFGCAHRGRTRGLAADKGPSDGALAGALAV